ncbi:hypothetical protein MRX96_016131 [Rhipicephalus microplus]
MQSYIADQPAALTTLPDSAITRTRLSQNKARVRRKVLHEVRRRATLPEACGQASFAEAVGTDHNPSLLSADRRAFSRSRDLCVEPWRHVRKKAGLLTR